MAMVNFSLCVMLVLYQMSTVLTDEASSENKDNGFDEPKESEEGDGVRCYCNTAQCVGTGYMCRSLNGGGCYSEVPAPRLVHHARHGCLHHLADVESEALSRCQNSPNAHAPPSVPQTLLLCCFRDLCNHEDSPVARAKLNLTAHEEGGSVASERGVGAGYTGEVWFRVATIAVPVCGALILFVLVGVAIRLLRADALLHVDRKLRGGISSLAQPEDVKKVWIGGPSAPLLVAPGGCLVAVERAQLVDNPQICDIQR